MNRTNHTDSITGLSSMSDEALLQEFIGSVLRGDGALYANSNLQVEPVLHSLQLFSKQDGLIASVNIKKVPIGIDVREETEYWDFLHRSLVEQNYLPISHKVYPKTFRYQYCPAPDGYQACCSTAKDLWRICWGRGFGLRHGIPLDMLFLAPSATERQKHVWQPLRGMDCDLGKLEIKLLGMKHIVDGQDLVVWAKRKPQEGRIPTYSHSLGLRHHRY